MRSDTSSKKINFLGQRFRVDSLEELRLAVGRAIACETLDDRLGTSRISITTYVGCGNRTRRARYADELEHTMSVHPGMLLVDKYAAVTGCVAKDGSRSLGTRQSEIGLTRDCFVRENGKQA